MAEPDTHIQAQPDDWESVLTNRPKVPQDLYSPLAEGQTRVLDLKPGRSNAPLVCEVFTIRYKAYYLSGGKLQEPASKVEFEALSYSWGYAPVSRSIICGGHECIVSPDLEEALRTLRNETTSRFIWVDAFCINQNDPEEKGIQVKDMGEIFSSAQKVLVWLGSPEKSSKIAKELKIVNELYVTDEKPRSYGWYDDAWETRQPKPLPDVYRYRLSIALKDCAWFSRTWVRQEVRAGGYQGQKIVVICPGGQISWTYLVDLAIRVIRPFAEYSTEECGLLFADLEDPVTAIAHHYLHVDRLNGLGHLGRSSRTDLGLLVRSSLVFKASDPKDKVYGIIGMYVGLPEADPRAEASKQSMGIDSFAVDYRKSVAEIYTEMARYVIRKNSHLGLLELHGFQHRENKMQLPSWVLDWDRPILPIIRGVHAALIRIYGSQMEPHLKNKNIFHRDPKEEAKLPPKFSLKDDADPPQPKSVLSVQGFGLGIIQVAHLPDVTPKDQRQSYTNCVPDLCDTVVRGAQIYIQNENLVPLLQDDVGTFWERAKVGIEQEDNPSFIDLVHHHLQSKATVEFSWAFESPSQIWEHAYFLPWCEAGDLVVWFRGGSLFPFVLRRRDDLGSDCYTFIGPVLLYKRHDKNERHRREMMEDRHFLKDVPVFLNAMTEEAEKKLKTFNLA